MYICTCFLLKYRQLLVVYWRQIGGSILPKAITFLSCACIVATLFFVSGCKSSGSSDDSSDDSSGSGSSGGTTTYSIGFSQEGHESTWRDAQIASIKSSLSGAGYTVIYKDANLSHTQQIADVRSLITSKVKVIVLDCVQDTGWETVLGEAKTAGIPVIFADKGATLTDTTLYASSVTSDFTEEAKQVAIALAAKFPAGGVDIVELEGTSGSAAAV
jgi:galactofuranose transport system substrate-binding protein